MNNYVNLEISTQLDSRNQQMEELLYREFKTSDLLTQAQIFLGAASEGKESSLFRRIFENHYSGQLKQASLTLLNQLGCLSFRHFFALRGDFSALLSLCSNSKTAEIAIQILNQLETTGWAEINRSNEKGETLLLCATRAGSEELVVKLLRLGANPLAKTKYSKNTPLHLAALREDIGIAYHLIQSSPRAVLSQDALQKRAVDYVPKSSPKMKRWLRHCTNLIQQDQLLPPDFPPRPSYLENLKRIKIRF